MHICMEACIDVYIQWMDKEFIWYNFFYRYQVKEQIKGKKGLKFVVSFVKIIIVILE